MTCTVIKEKDSVTFVCFRGHKKEELTAEDQRKIDECLTSLVKELEEKDKENDQER